MISLRFSLLYRQAVTVFWFFCVEVKESIVVQEKVPCSADKKSLKEGIYSVQTNPVFLMYIFKHRNNTLPLPFKTDSTADP